MLLPHGPPSRRGRAGAGPGAGAEPHPEQGPAQSRAGAELVPPFRLILSKAPVWAILLSSMPFYFKQVTGLDLRQAAWLSALPWAVMAASSLAAGVAADALASRGMSTTRIRKTMQAIGFLGPCVSLLALTRARHPGLAVALLTVALGSSAFSQAGFLLNYKDIAPRFVGVLHGISNTAGTLAGITSTVVAGVFVDGFGSFTSVLLLTSFFYALGTAVWLVLSTAEIVLP